jgi:CMP-N-acetylneuraminic acid synthetase
MGMFDETANVHYRLSFANQGKQTLFSVCRKQTEVYRFCLLFAENKRKFVDEQIARQRLGQHWFITKYIAALIYRDCCTLCTRVL